MEIKINVDETMFKDIIDKELKAFSKEELHEITRECIIEVFRNDKNIVRLFLDTSDWYGKDRPSDLLVAAANKIDLSPAFKEIQEDMISTLKNNYKEVLEHAMLRAIRTNFANSYEFCTVMETTIDEILRRKALETQ